MLPTTSPLYAAQYARMSTEKQEYSLTYQMAANAAYAMAQGYEIVRTYTDEGVSGLRIDKREGLKQLLADVVTGTAPFDIVIVYDVSRWGRFQNPDQAAHYEFICEEAGVRIQYSAETFPNDGSLTSTLLKTLKRAMAAEYSRDLSRRTTRAKRGLVELGFWIGRAAPYGLRRCYVARSGKQVMLEYGDHKPVANGRTILVRGPEAEVRNVRRIFRWYLRDALSCAEIARRLNDSGNSALAGAEWTERSVTGVLRNEVYAGIMVFRKTATDLGVRGYYPTEEWRRLKLKFEPIVSMAMLRAAAKERQNRLRAPSNDELLQELRRVYALDGGVSEVIIRRAAIYGPHTYAMRFGGLPQAYAAAGIPLSSRHINGGNLASRRRRTGTSALSDDQVLERLSKLLANCGRLTGRLIDRNPGGPTRDTLVRRFGSLTRAYHLVGYQPTESQAKSLGRAAWTNHKRKIRKRPARV